MWPWESAPLVPHSWGITRNAEGLRPSARPDMCHAKSPSPLMGEDEGEGESETTPAEPGGILPHHNSGLNPLAPTLVGRRRLVVISDPGRDEPCILAIFGCAIILVANCSAIPGCLHWGTSLDMTPCFQPSYCGLGGPARDPLGNRTPRKPSSLPPKPD